MTKKRLDIDDQKNKIKKGKQFIMILNIFSMDMNENEMIE